MQKAIIVVASLLLGSGSGAGQAQAPVVSSSLVRADTHATARAASLMRVDFVEPQAPVTRGQIAVCANLAASRALDAKAMGASYAAQDRTLDLTFLLCMAGPQSAD